MPAQEQIYKRDYIYMRLQDGPVIKVSVADMVQYMVQGYVQSKPPAGEEQEG